MKELFKKLNLSVSDLEQPVFTEAFTHRSAVNEKSDLKKHNERLEFLGDAVLELITTEFLYAAYPESPEGDLTNYRSALVKGDHLAEVARRLDLGKYLLLSKGEAKSGGAEKAYLLANVVESLIGAIYLTKGLKSATKFIEDSILLDIEEILENEGHIDAKSEFQELAQGTIGITPHYKVMSSSGLDHEKVFVMGAYLEDQLVGEGEGNSKKEAQTAAAEVALEKKKDWMKES